MRVLAVDDHRLFGAGLRLLLQAIDPGIACELAFDGDEGLRQVEAGAFDVILLDLHMQGLGGLDAVRRFREAAPEARLVVLSGERDARVVLDAIEAGAVGFISKEDPGDVLEFALETIAAGGVYLPSALLSGTRPAPAPGSGLQRIEDAFPALTARQAEVLAALLRGLSNKHIARQLGISDQTVKSHVAVILRELGVRSRLEAVYVAARQRVKIT